MEWVPLPRLECQSSAAGVRSAHVSTCGIISNEITFAVRCIVHTRALALIIGNYGVYRERERGREVEGKCTRAAGEMLSEKNTRQSEITCYCAQRIAQNGLHIYFTYLSLHILSTCCCGRWCCCWHNLNFNSNSIFHLEHREMVAHTRKTNRATSSPTSPPTSRSFHKFRQQHIGGTKVWYFFVCCVIVGVHLVWARQMENVCTCSSCVSPVIKVDVDVHVRERAKELSQMHTPLHTSHNSPAHVRMSTLSDCMIARRAMGM